MAPMKQPVGFQD